MFEDSTFESYGRIHTHSRAWMIATCAFNGTILMAMVVVPLVFPSALPNMAMRFLMLAPAPRVEEPRPVARVATVSAAPSQMEAGRIIMPTRIPTKLFIPETAEVARPVNVANTDFGGDNTNGANPFGSQTRHAEVHQAASGPVRVSGLVVEGMLIHRTMPVYPPIAVASRKEGVVVLQATISRAGNIENLRVISGPIMLQQAALNAVRDWRYRPYLLSGEPVEVETTVNVIFKLN
jgi:periplasmic protein TonB